MMSEATGAGIGAATEVIGNRINTGSWKGSGQSLVDGAASDFRRGALVGFAGG